MADDGPLQLSLSGQHHLAEITSPDFPGERLVACRNPALAADGARKRRGPGWPPPRNCSPPSSPASRPGKLHGRRAHRRGEAGKVIEQVQDQQALRGHHHRYQPVHRLEERVRAHVLICMLACYLTWHLRRAWAPLTSLTRNRPPRTTPPPRPAAPQSPRPRPHPSTTLPDSPTAASAACWTTWPR